jgi:hypothetical protein
VPKRIFEQPQLTLNGSDVSADVESAELIVSRRNAVNVTGLADTYEQLLTPNLRGWSLRINFFNNFDTSSGGGTAGISTVLRAVLNSSQSSGVAVTWRLTTGNQGPTNPQWQGQVGIDGDFGLTAGAVAEADKSSVTLRGLAALSYLTSSS